MTSDRDPFRDSEASDGMLDELLLHAGWPEGDPGAQERLRTKWSDIFRAAGGSPRLSTQRRVSARSSRWLTHWIVAAAAILAIASAIWLVMHNRPTRSPVVKVEPVPTPKAVPAAAPTQIPLPQPEPIVRPLGPVERLALIGDKQRSKRKSPGTQPGKPVDAFAYLRRLDNAALTRFALQTHDAERQRAVFSLLLQRNDLQSFLYFVLKSDTRPQALATLDAMPNPPINALLAELDHSQVDYRLAAAKALGGLCSRGLGQTFMAMIQQNDHRREAIAALLSCSDPHAKQFLSRAQAYASADEIRSVQHDLNRTF